MSIEFDNDARDLLDRLAPPPQHVRAWDEVLARATRPAADPDSPEAGSLARGVLGALPRRLSGHRAFAAAGAAAAVVGVVVVVLLAPWKSSSVLLSDAQAATVVRHAIAAASPSTGIFHERYTVTGVPFAGAGRVVTATNELWRETNGAHRFRSINETIVPSVRIEIASTPDQQGLSLYDPRTNAIYAIPRGYAILPLGPTSSASGLTSISDTLKQDLAAGTLASTWGVTKTTLDGRDVYRISNAETSAEAPGGITYYVDAKTYAPVQIEEAGPPKNQPGGIRNEPRRSYEVSKRYPASVTTTRILTFEQLDSTETTLDQLDLHTAHPDAQTLPFADLRPDVKKRAQAISTLNQGAAPSTAPKPARLTVDPLKGSIGSFTVGDNLLALTLLVNQQLQNFGSQPGNFKDAAAVGTLDSNGAIIVTFSDPAEEHSTSAYLNRPFTTTRGDVNDSPEQHDGTTLDEFLGHWPDHGAPAHETGPNGWAATTVTVGQGTFYFGQDGRLGAVVLGNGDAAHYAFGH